jgi:hypothetical protein
MDLNNLFPFALSILLLICVNSCSSQTTMTVLGNVQITYANRGTFTDFLVTCPLSQGMSLTNAWVGVGFNLNQKMVRYLTLVQREIHFVIFFFCISKDLTNAVICINSNAAKSVDNYWIRGYSPPNYLDLSIPKLGLSNTQVTSNNGNFLCSFRRENSVTTNSNYFNLNNQKPYLIVAYGDVNTDGSMILLFFFIYIRPYLSYLLFVQSY